MHVRGGSRVGVDVPVRAGVGVGVGVGAVVLGDDTTDDATDDAPDDADVAAAAGAPCCTGGPLSPRTCGAPGGSTTAGRAALTAPASMVAGGGPCCDGTSAGPDPSLGEAVAGGRLPVPAGGAAFGGTRVGVSATARGATWELGEWLLPSASISPPPRATSAVTAPTAARVRPARRGVDGTPVGESTGSAESSARIRSAASAAGLRRVRPDRSSVSTTWASVARRFASSSCIGSSARGDGGRVPRLSMVSRPGRPGCRVPRAGACPRGRGPARPPGSSSSGSPRG